MRTHSYTVDDAEHFAQYFAALSHDPQASRSLHAQATSFYWLDEMPVFVDDGYPASLRHFMIYLLSYRKVLMYGERVDEFEPLWNRLTELCPDWPGFIPSRRDPSLIPQFEAEVDDMLNRLGRAINVHTRRGNHKRKLQEQRASESPPDSETT